MVFKALKSLFSAGDVVGSIERVAAEWIETDIEKAEAQTLMLKTLDPNGAMRRQLSRDVTQLYKVYILTALALIVMEFFGLGQTLDVDIPSATSKIVELFVPITSLFGVIVTASFGVNCANTIKNK